MSKRRLRAVGLALLACLAPPALAQDLSPTSARQQIVNATLLDAASTNIVHGWIEFADGQITKVAAGDPPTPAPNVLDARGLTVIPGMIDTHQHLFAYHSLRSQRATDRHLRRVVRRQLKATLLQGFTTIAVPGDFGPELFSLRNELANAAQSGPSLVAAGPFVQARDDHPSATLCAANRFCRDKLAITVATANEAQQAVRALAANGAQLIKAVHDTELQPAVVIDDALIVALRDAARDTGLPLVMHVRVAADLVHLAELGVRRFTHTPLIGELASTPGAERLAQHEIAVQTTLSWAAPKAARRQPGAKSKAKTRLATGLGNVRYLVDQGIPVAFGTDNPPPLAGRAAATELQLLQEVLTPAELLRALTRDAALFLNQQRAVGALRPGMCADLVLLASDPRTDPQAWQKVAHVFRGGERVRRR